MSPLDERGAGIRHASRGRERAVNAAAAAVWLVLVASFFFFFRGIIFPFVQFGGAEAAPPSSISHESSLFWRIKPTYIPVRHGGVQLARSVATWGTTSLPSRPAGPWCGRGRGVRTASNRLSGTRIQNELTDVPAWAFVSPVPAHSETRKLRNWLHS